MASREWLITKVVGLALGIITIVSICIGGANVVVNLQSDVRDTKGHIVRVDERVDKHIDHDDAKFDKVYTAIDVLKEKNHALELAMTEQTVRFNYIVDELRTLNSKMDNLEVVE
jgi:hypothetical protein